MKIVGWNCYQQNIKQLFNPKLKNPLFNKLSSESNLKAMFNETIKSLDYCKDTLIVNYLLIEKDSFEKINKIKFNLEEINLYMKNEVKCLEDIK